MMLSVIVNSIEYRLDDGTICRLLAHDGWGMPENKRLTERGPLQHGHTDLGYYLEDRDGMLVLGIVETELQEMYDRRKELLNLFKPQNNPILKWSLPNGDVRQIVVHHAGDLSIPWKVENWAAVKVGLDLEAPDPSFYDPELETMIFTVQQENELSFPIEFPIKYNPSVIVDGALLTNEGTWETYPTIKLTGPMQNPIIQNVSLGLKLELGYTVSADEIVTISLKPGEKTIVNDSDESLIGTLTDDSDLGTFRLEVDPILANGQNSITITLGGATAGTKVEFKWYHRYVGL